MSMRAGASSPIGGRARERFARLDAVDSATALPDAPPDLDRTVSLHRIEVVVTDFLVSPDRLRVLDTVALG